MGIADSITGGIEVLTDNFIAIGIVGVSLYLAVVTTTPEWLIALSGLIVKDYLPSMKQKTE
jgi:hypothetical protein